MPTQKKKRILTLIDEACSSGARLKKACAITGLSPRTIQRWRSPEKLEDRRKESSQTPANKLSEMERQKILKTINSPAYRNLSPHQIVADLADQETYLASEATMYRILREEGQNTHRQPSKPKRHNRPEELTAAEPNQVWTWDITYLPGPVRGVFFYLYMIIDLYSRKIITWQIHTREGSTLAGGLISEGCYLENITRDQLVLHSDNGAPMKGATMLATLQQLGVMPSFSRPGVSNDNAHSEALYKTLKYRPWYPQKPFKSLSDARTWVEGFVQWYNHEHRHSSLAYVTPNDRHTGRDKEILARRRVVYQRAKMKNPERWSGQIRKWSAPSEVTLNKKRTSNTEKIAA
ncbi:IS3 family transposase [Desulfonatronovibrio hydrogenovorans]|uniref:IS3 family transposase n=1 Tax=Desulfonatronovibrio hydrogenovorans TaxID=53245 RepID=UPI00048F861A|nr:IS3 family transposase [Desulfonatronovibrio hydrogenovorans]